MKYYFKITVLLLYAMVVIGILLPFLYSQASDLMVFFGIMVTILTLPSIFFLTKWVIK